jgi:hypothetical protein
MKPEPLMVPPGPENSQMNYMAGKPSLVGVLWGVMYEGRQFHWNFTVGFINACLN